nr:immunoglobulin heavy chain junction region [Mus musculus]MBK4185688.1 immunoglobulin heavy chain junction region [Mus musculus]MBK4185689.1 immunoglobulin heavy chain junction region [Mus musculus]MBK4185690.1 immunoglobulin heavy chain junction region [Mus musculus]MBK4185691.1 immunoglobulin heavy chain junction region [Mus musculus]
CARWILYGDFW